MRIIVLFLLTAWLVFSLPADAFLWTTIDKTAFDNFSVLSAQGWYDVNWWFGLGRGLVVGAIPILIIWLRSGLQQQHGQSARRSYQRKEQTITLEEYAKTYQSKHTFVISILNTLFNLIAAVIGLSYLLFYIEYGMKLKAYDTQYIGELIKWIVLLTRTGVSILFVYVLGYLADVTNLGTLFEKKVSEKQKEELEPIPKIILPVFQPCPGCGFQLKVGKDGTTKRAYAGHSRKCPGLRKEEGDF